MRQSRRGRGRDGLGRNHAGGGHGHQRLREERRERVRKRKREKREEEKKKNKRKGQDPRWVGLGWRTGDRGCRWRLWGAGSPAWDLGGERRGVDGDGGIW